MGRKQRKRRIPTLWPSRLTIQLGDREMYYDREDLDAVDKRDGSPGWEMAREKTQTENIKPSETLSIIQIFFRN